MAEIQIEKSIKRMAHYLNERYEIMKKRESGKPAPWTKDEIFQRYSFTNLDREKDKDTIYVKSILETIPSRKWRAIASFTMRFFQDMDGFDERFKDIYVELFNESYFKEKAWALETNGFWDRLGKDHWRTELNYKTGSIKKSDIFELLMELYSTINEERFNSLTSPMDIKGVLLSINGIGEFMSTQITLDLRMCEDSLKRTDIKYHDKGTKWGTWWMIYNTDHKFIEKDKASYAMVKEHKHHDWGMVKRVLLRETIKYLVVNNMLEIAAYLETITLNESYNWNNILCEFQKYSYIDYWKREKGIFVKTTAYRKLGKYGISS